MTLLPSSLLRRVRWGRRATVLGRALWRSLYVRGGLVLVLALVLVAGLAYLRLSWGPLSFAGLADRVAGAIATQMGPGWRVEVSDSALALEDGSLALRTTGLDIRNPDGILIVRAPHAIVSVATASLLTGALQPRAIEFRDLQLNASISKDGTLSFVPAGETGTPSPTAAPQMAGKTSAVPSTGSAEPSPLSVAVASLFDAVFEGSGIVGALDRARLSNARLRIVDEDRKERATFGNVSATFERSAADRRHFELRSDGPRGGWRIQGEVRLDEEGHRAGTLTATDVPVQDLLLLSGFSGAPVDADLKFTGQIEAAVHDGRLTRFETRLASGKGVLQINAKDMPPIEVDAASAEAAWDEGRRLLGLKSLIFKSGATDIRLAGALHAAAGQPWRLELAGKNALVRGAGASDPPLAISTIEASASGQDGGIAVERLVLQGPRLNATIDASYGAAPDPEALAVNIWAEETDVRAALALWPQAVVTKLRRFLAENFRSGTLETLGVSVAMSGEELAGATSEQPIPDASVRVDFAVGDGVLQAAEGLPPLSRLRLDGSVTGAKANVKATQGAVVTSDGRALALSQGSFVLPDIWAPDAAAAVSFRLDGGADALGSLLQMPLLRNVSGGLDLDPARVKGRADLRVVLKLPIENTPEIGDLPVSITGGVSGLAIEKLFGNERLENGQLAVSYDGGGLTIRGEGRISGSPASIDVRQPRGGVPGEALVSLLLDEAGRERKGIALGSGLSGNLPVRVAMALGERAKQDMKFEVDLTRATIDHLIPGWTKPAGRPGRVAFAMAEGGYDVRDVVIDSGSVQLRGSATLSSDGGVDKADLTTFKLSPGDDMRVQLDRKDGVFRANVRGNVADARPFLKAFTSPPGPSSASGGSKDQRDIDLDLAVNILTGFNDEALTNAVLKASLRAKDLRQLQLNGRFRSAQVMAQLVRAERTTPALILQSQDAGATLRFLDIYRRMIGGSVTFQISMGETPQRGTIIAQSFALKDEPALRRIVSQQPQAAMAEDRSAAVQLPTVDFNEVQFNTLKAEFIRSASRLDFRDATLWGSQVGFTVGGWIDYARDRTDISGTFVPAYGLNNAFAQVPLFGPILGGGRNEGLFAVNFRISGAASTPTLTVNPLSAVAPGFLRKLFGVGGISSEATGAVPPRPER